MTGASSRCAGRRRRSSGRWARPGRAACALPAGNGLAAAGADGGRRGGSGARLVPLRRIPHRASLPDRLDSLVIVDGTRRRPAPPLAAGAERGARLAASVGLARDLVNEPPSSLTPRAVRRRDSSTRFADVADLSIEVWDEDRIADERLGGLLGVARGSAQPPRLVKVEYRPPDPFEVDGRVPHLALVGQGDHLRLGRPLAQDGRAAWRP